MANRPIINTASAAGITLKQLEDWVTMEEASGILEISRSGVAYLIFHIQVFDFDKDIRKLGKAEIVCVRRSALLKLKRERDADARLKEQAAQPQVQQRQTITPARTRKTASAKR